jgi:hypothetical protein
MIEIPPVAARRVKDILARPGAQASLSAYRVCGSGTDFDLREFPAPVLVTERLWVTVAAFSGGKQSDKFNYPYGSSLLRQRQPEGLGAHESGALALSSVFRFRLFRS